jgi:hypothetical protein
MLSKVGLVIPRTYVPKANIHQEAVKPIAEGKKPIQPSRVSKEVFDNLCSKMPFVNTMAMFKIAKKQGRRKCSFDVFHMLNETNKMLQKSDPGYTPFSLTSIKKTVTKLTTGDGRSKGYPSPEILLETLEKTGPCMLLLHGIQRSDSKYVEGFHAILPFTTFIDENNIRQLVFFDFDDTVEYQSSEPVPHEFLRIEPFDDFLRKADAAWNALSGNVSKGDIQPTPSVEIKEVNSEQIHHLRMCPEMVVLKNPALAMLLSEEQKNDACEIFREALKSTVLPEE